MKIVLQIPALENLMKRAPGSHRRIRTSSLLPRRLDLEALEGRLPPGDVVFGGVLGSWWLGALSLANTNLRAMQPDTIGRKGHESAPVVAAPAPLFVWPSAGLIQSAGHAATPPNTISSAGRQQGLADWPSPMLGLAGQGTVDDLPRAP